MPAAAVIPAPIAYIKVAAVKKLVVDHHASHLQPATVSCVSVVGSSVPSSRCRVYSSLSGPADWIVYFEKIRVFQAGSML